MKNGATMNNKNSGCGFLLLIIICVVCFYMCKPDPIPPDSTPPYSGPPEIIVPTPPREFPGGIRPTDMPEYPAPVNH